MRAEKKMYSKMENFFYYRVDVLFLSSDYYGKFSSAFTVARCNYLDNNSHWTTKDFYIIFLITLNKAESFSFSK